MKLDGQGMPVTDLQGVLPAVGVTLPSGASLSSGGLNVNFTLDGPVDKLVIVGPVDMENAKLAGFNLKSKLGALFVDRNWRRRKRQRYGHSDIQREFARRSARGTGE